MKEINLQEQKYLDQIASKLWNGNEFGNAAVLIGSGFSRNAEKRSLSSKEYPLWYDLSIALFDELYPEFINDPTKKSLLTSGNGALKLAQEYEVSFGRQTLDDFLLKMVPDNDYFPGYNHKLLLSLPWSDIFTTNYDTLLEKSCDMVYDKNYSLVQTIADIPTKNKPRIIKLHGSFPSTRPFIFTEEDYRKYPSEFAPFVNMVQQSLMENAFVLLGFSGDDPNFLHWIGWVRDNLKKSTPKIYLCGILNLSDSQKKVLELKNIIPIDLSPLFPLSSWPDKQERHIKASEWFLLYLHHSEPPNKLNWPFPSNEQKYLPSDDRLKIVTPKKNLVELGEMVPKRDEITKEKLGKTLQLWKEKRIEFPGWVLPPFDIVETLWRYTRGWIDPIISNIEMLPPPLDIALAYELFWRIEKSFMALFIEWVEPIEKLLSNYNPFPTIIETDHLYSPKKAKCKDWDWKTISEQWIYISLQIARELRDDQNLDLFIKHMNVIKEVVKKQQHWYQEYIYELCQFYLYRLNHEEVSSILSDWPENPEYPFWMSKKASVIAELGDLEKAEILAEESLKLIRNNILANQSDYTLLSQEGIVMLLLKLIKENKIGQVTDIVSLYKSRWNTLSMYNCNPWPNLDLMRSKILEILPEHRPQKEVIKKFDPGEITISHNFGSDQLSQYHPSFVFLRMYENIGIPLRCGYYTVFQNDVSRAASNITQFAQIWALSSIIRSGNDKEIKKIFSRFMIARLSQSQINILYDIYIVAFQKSINNLDSFSGNHKVDSKSFSQRIAIILAEIHSRLCFRYTENQLDNLFKLTIIAYKSNAFKSNHLLHRPLSVLFKRIFFLFDSTKIISLLEQLIHLPIPNNDDFEVKTPDAWPEPFEFINIKSKGNVPISSETFIRGINNLLNWSKSNNPDSRRRSVLRLIVLYDLGLLTKKYQKKLGSVLWYRINDKTGFPSDVGFYNYAYLRLPSPDTINVKEKVYNYLKNANFNTLVTYSKSKDGKKTRVFALGGNYNRLFQEWIGATVPIIQNGSKGKNIYIDWEKTDVTELLEKLNILWESEKQELDSAKRLSFLSPYDSVFDHLSNISRLLRKVIIPKLEPKDTKSIKLVLKLIEEMAAKNVPFASVIPSILLLKITDKKDIISKFETALHSNNADKVRDAVFGVFEWCIYTRDGRISESPNVYIAHLVSKLISRSQPSLDSVIGQLSVIVSHTPELFSDDQINLLLLALENLINETDVSSINEDSYHFRSESKLQYRELASQLAYELYKLHSDQNLDIPQVLTKWRNIGESDVLPEVRKPWIDNSS